ncbi:ABC transporter permease [Mycoplasmopsis californica]|uniref:ABC transporter permease n=1 Tax=Mycoplasmopsis californica TaxID=2113 RepID=UPI000EB712C5|nr:ABC transporter permease [Mycoplasmopsis californica]BBG42682.1 sugar ABC transporter permease [Mycoplasmopsis californica]BBG43257.1 sugar ABC transporter permease [Mycoplasmopsis californica]
MESKQKPNMIDSLRKASNWASNFIRMDKTKSTGRKIASSLWSLFFGVVLSLLYIIIKKGLQEQIFVNPFTVVTTIFSSFNQANKETILKYFLVFGFSSVACALSFKAGLFNIGIPGQMMISGGISFAIFIQYGATQYQAIPAWLLIMCLICSVLIAFGVGIIAGALKAYLNVHEVISTIMLNWIIIGISMMLFRQNSASVVWKNFSDAQAKYYFSDDLSGVKPGFVTISAHVKEIFVICGVVGLLTLAAVVAFIFNFTTLGYKIRMQGISKSNGKYMGVNDKMLTMMVLGVSAAISAIAGFYYYVISEQVFSGISQPINLGFEAIAISLLALNSPIGSLFSTLFYTAIYTSEAKLQLYPLYIRPEDLKVITSIILYLAATSIMFSQFKPIQFSTRTILLLSDPRYLRYKKLESLLKRKVRIVGSYEQKIHLIEQKINQANYSISLKRLEKINESFANKITKIDNAITQARINCQKAEEYTLQKIVEKNKNVELYQALNLEYDLNDNKNYQDSIPSEIKTNIELNNSTDSFIDQIKHLKKELAKSTDKYLSQAMNYKNTDDQTIKHFESINAEKMRINAELNRLGINAKFRIKQQKTAQIKDINTEYQNIYASISEQRSKLYKDRKHKQGGQNGINN